MVRMGRFEVQLVDAETKLPFPEVASSTGTIQTHIPLHREYFIRVKSDMLEDERVLVNFRINGAKLGYEVKLGDKASHCGQKGRALQVVQDHTSTDFSTVGTIQATFYEAVTNSSRRPQRRSTEQVTRFSETRMGGRRCLSLPDFAALGDHSETKARVGSKKKYTKGRVLSRVELKYTDTLEPAPRRKLADRSKSVPRLSYCHEEVDSPLQCSFSNIESSF
jgi:hypothetical protein